MTPLKEGVLRPLELPGDPKRMSNAVAAANAANKFVTEKPVAEKTIAELEAELATALEALRELEARAALPAELKPLLKLAPPAGGSVHVSLRHREKGRQIRRSFLANSFHSRSCGAWLVYEGPLEEKDGDEKEIESSGRPLEDLVRALALAEAEPHLSFVSIKWFRDTYLPKCGFAWALDSDLPRRTLMEATTKGMVITAKVANPKTPAFPVATIKLNRSHGEVDRILGSR